MNQWDWYDAARIVVATLICWLVWLKIKPRFGEWYEIYGCLLLKAVLIPATLLILALAVPVFWIPLLFWITRNKVMD